MKPKWIAGLAAMCLVSAVVASGITALSLTRGLFGGSETETNGSESQPTTQTTVTPKATPTQKPTSTPSPTPSVSPTPSAEPTPTQTGGGDALIILQTQQLIENIYEAISPSVISIEVEVSQSGSSILKTSQGSGLILRQTGEIATNASILSLALDNQGNLLANATLTVRVKGVEKPFDATFVGQDVMTGLAVIKIDPGETKLMPAKFAADMQVRIGQVVLAVGYPEILYESGGLSSGLITGISRTVLLEDGTAVQMIQTNAPISLACSGGPLLNLSGEVIGLTNCAVSREAIESLSYVLPAETVSSVATDLITTGQVSGRAWLGISVLSEDSFKRLQDLYGFPDGLYVSNVIKDSPAYKADLRNGDIITEINGDAVGVSMNIARFLQSQPVGAQVSITVYRRSDGKYHDLKAYLQEKIN